MLKAIVTAAAALVTSTAIAAEPAMPSADYGRTVSIIGGCNDCHTPGYSETSGKIDPAAALAGSPVGYQGPWGTTYAANLRLLARGMSEDDWVKFLSTFTTRPPMPYYNVWAMDEVQKRSLYRYIVALGDSGKPAPDYVPPGTAPNTPYIVFAPPVMPKP